MPFELPTTEEKHDYVHAQFERIAAKYDLTNDAISMGMHRLWKRTAVAELMATKSVAFPNRGKFLDVCCGTGDLALTVATQMASQGEVTGLDFSGNMLSVGRQRAKSASQRLGGNLAKLDWVQGDAQDMPFEDDTFDGAIISFGLRNLTDFQAGVNEMTRVVKPGGTVINLDLGKPEGLLFAPLFAMYFRHFVPIIGAVLQGDYKAYTYLPESKSTYPNPEGITRIFETAGLVEVKHIALASGSVALHVGTVPGA
jgi:ubiquinone/menaquinone biosynthesis methyltransferases